MRLSKVQLLDLKITIDTKAINLNGNNWIYDEDSDSFLFKDFILKNVTEKGDEEEWWKIYFPGLEVSGSSPDGCYNALVDIRNSLNEVINGTNEVPELLR